jgi:hypothetical protein
MGRFLQAMAGVGRFRYPHCLNIKSKKAIFGSIPTGSRHSTNAIALHHLNGAALFQKKDPVQAATRLRWWWVQAFTTPGFASRCARSSNAFSTAAGLKRIRLPTRRHGMRWAAASARNHATGNPSRAAVEGAGMNDVSFSMPAA